ncbi:hypothetical protein QVD17_35782 [Tagetes erecta]|uniref:Uncharacterized protein n=1 Tax=Tagetes erecta TaxID=13708 RepID=A0AAD8JV28_TARER|nr:hypothetical protein QVD17_35782 [Tagetes erecta]
MEKAESSSSAQQDDIQINPGISITLVETKLKLETSTKKLSSAANDAIATIKSPAPPVKDDALKAAEIKDSGSISSTLSVNKPAAPSVNEETKHSEVLLVKIFNLEEEVVSLTQKKAELELEIEEDLKDVSLYMSGTKLETEVLIKQLEEYELVMKDAQKLANSEINIQIQIKETIKNILDGLPKQDKKTSQRIVELSMQFSEYCTRLDAVFQVLVASLRSSLTQIRSLEEELLAHSTLKATLEESENVMKPKPKQLEELKRKLDQANSGINKNKEIQKDLKADLKSKSVELSTLMTKQNDLECIIESLQTKNNIVEGDLAKEKSYNKALRSRVEELEREVSRQSEVTSVTTEQKNKISGALETLKDLKCSKEGSIQTLKTCLNELEADSKQAASSFENQIKQLKSQVTQVKSEETETLKNHAQLLENERITLGRTVLNAISQNFEMVLLTVKHKQKKERLRCYSLIGNQSCGQSEGVKSDLESMEVDFDIEDLTFNSLKTELLDNVKKMF